MKRLLTLLILLLALQGFTQDIKRTNVWYFGYNAGLDFSMGNPIKTTNGALSAIEGCASICDTSGNLLFYTNGLSVWDKNHQLLPNGSGLLGEATSTQTALIIPQPGNDSLFYLFTVNAGGAGTGQGFKYSIISKLRNGGMGDLIVKNVHLLDSTTEKLCAVMHQNGKDVWIITHNSYNNKFYLFLLNKYGVLPCPVINEVGETYDIYHKGGQMKVSPSGKRLAISTWGGGTVELYDLNCTTGKISNLSLLNNLILPYGIEFSKDESKLYIMEAAKRLFQFNINLPTDSLINANRVLLFTTNPSYQIQALQLGSDNKIYLAIPDTSLGIINYPDSLGSSCNFVNKAINLSPKYSAYGLPSFVSSYFHNPKLNFSYQVTCTGLIGSFEGKAIQTPSSWNWRIKRVSNSSTANYNTQNFSYTFPDSGWYEVRLIANADTIIKTIFIDAPILPITDTLGCGVDSVVLAVPATYRCLQWSDTSASLYNRIIKTSGVYLVEGYNSLGCLIKDSIKINFSPSPSKPTITKINDSLISSPASTYKWLLNDTLLAGAITQSIKPLKAGLYKVVVTDSNGCSNISTAFSSNVAIKPIILTPFRIYPNPANDILNIESGEALNELKIYDITGRTIYEKSKITDSILKIDLKEFLGGIYFIKINSNLSTYYSQKIIIQ